MLFLTSFALTLRANANVRIPYWRNARIIPPGTVLMRSAGAGLTVLGAVPLSANGWGWMLILLGMLAIPLLMIPIHNGRVARQAVA
ncbi:hypothetical protein ASD65_01960 [Microbacterium sp. Root61]|uniref:hypothetical protein n=1 Tax=Microbacterium sp. Root61 TaxID=1736570 RepID=UPI0006F65A37|nr:hypothetical protein [Microbacterium sp. Root61]KRA23319.1 hypothetical protein ASD65_01960 [Microbacterium sp. Root61]